MRVFTLRGAEQPYRDMVETMSEGAVNCHPDGMMLYRNQRFAEMIKADLRTIMGSSLLARFAALTMRQKSRQHLSKAKPEQRASGPRCWQPMERRCPEIW